jgi:filamentous hemagglutinin family protein
MNRTVRPLIQLLLTGTALTSPLSVGAGELPRGASTVHGGVSISNPSANQMTIQQTTSSAIVNWQGFSIGQGARVDIDQPSASSAILNRVTGSAPSTIAGQLNANGQVYLVNPNGIAITKSGTVQAGAFVASTLDTSDQDFKAGKRIFQGTGQSATVSNQGSITVQKGGYAALLGGRVENSGLISVPMGKVGLGAGEQATLDFSGDGFLQVAVPSRKDSSDAALIQHSGQIRAPGGTVVMQAATARDAARNAINLSGLVEARSVSGRSGAIVLSGGEGGSVTISGKLDASAGTPSTRQATASKRTSTPARGGNITVTGNHLRLSGATLIANGTADGGKIRVGGDYQGKGSLQRASTTTVDAATTISANAGASGDGGNIVVWSDQMTRFSGRISAKGGDQTGNGGQAEVSSHGVLDYTGTTILTAAKGAFGTLLLDPYNVTISNEPDTNSSVSGCCSVGTVSFTPTGNDSVINATTLQNALATANVTVTTGGDGSPGTQAGNITVDTPLIWGKPSSSAASGASTLTLNAYRSIILNANLTINGDGGLALNTNLGGADGILSFGPGASATFVAGPSGSNQGLMINGNAYTLIYSMAALDGIDGRRSSGNEIIVQPDGIVGRYALASNLDASGTTYFDALIGGVDLNNSSSSNSVFRGTFEGLGHSVSNLTINQREGIYTGLFGLVGESTIQNLNLNNIRINAVDGNNGALAGGIIVAENAANIAGISASGVQLGGRRNGGLIGSVNASASGSFTLTRSNSSVSIDAGVNDNGAVGGLIGQIFVDSGASVDVSKVYSTGNVFDRSSNYTGGLIGNIQATALSADDNTRVQIAQAYATGNVTGADRTGGLVGGIDVFTRGADGGARVDVTQVYSTGIITGPGNTGGLIGANSIGSNVNQAYATGSVASRAGFVGGLIGINTGVVTQAYATGAVSGGAGFAGGLFGSDAGRVASSFWDTQTTGQLQAAGSSANILGATGLTTAQFQDANVFVPLASQQGWNFQTTWAPPSAGNYPQLYSINPVIYVAGDNARRLYGRANPDFTGTPYGGPGVYVFDTAPIAQIDAGSLLSSSATPATDVGRYPFTTVTPFTSRTGTTYRVTSTGILQIDKAPLTVAANNQAKTYGTAFTFAGNEFTTTGLQNGETLTQADLASAGQPSTANAGAYAITVGNARGGTANLNNYDLSYALGTLTVNRAAASVIANNQAKTYGTAFTFAGNEFTTTGLQNGETLTQADLASAGQPSTANAGAYAITVGNARGGTANLNNYDLSYALGTLSVNQSSVQSPSLAEQASTLANATYTPNIQTFLPPFTTPSLNLVDVINLAGPGDNLTLGGGGPTLGVGQGSSRGLSGDTGDGSSTVASGNKTLAAINTASANLEAKLSNCDKSSNNSANSYTACVGGSLESFADELDLQVQQLPPAFRSLPAVIRQAAERVRAAPAVVAARGLTGAAARAAIIAESRAAVRVAVAAVRKTIALLRADEPAVARVQVRQGQAIASALQTVDTRLSKAVGL